MALTTKVHRTYGAVKLGSDYLDQNASVALDPGIQDLILADGVDDQFVAVAQQDPRITIMTSAIATALGLAGIAGKKLTVAGDNMDVWLRRAESLGLYSAGSTHVKLTVTNGLFYPQGITADNISAAINYEVVPFFDGTNDPIIIATGQALSGTPAVDEAFVAGPVYINGTLLEGIQSIAIDFGIELILIFAEGGVWATFLSIGRRRPVIRIQTVDALAIDTFGLSGTAQTGTDSVIYLRAVKVNGMREANSAAAHIKFSVDDGMIRVGPVAGDVATPIGSEVLIKPTWDGDNDVLAITTGQQITA